MPEQPGTLFRERHFQAEAFLLAVLNVTTDPNAGRPRAVGNGSPGGAA